MLAQSFLKSPSDRMPMASLPVCTESKWPLLTFRQGSLSRSLSTNHANSPVFLPSCYLLLFHFTSWTVPMHTWDHKTEGSLSHNEVTLSQTKPKQGCGQVFAWLSMFTFPVVCGLTGRPLHQDVIWNILWLLTSPETLDHHTPAAVSSLAHS